MTEESKQLQTLARMIAEHMEGWTYQPAETDAHTACISMPENNDKTPGATIIMSFNWRDKARLYIRGEYPKHEGYEYPSPKHDTKRPDITVSINKTPEQIAKDISRRLLPQYLNEYEEGLGLVRIYTENSRKMTQLVSELQALIPGSELFDRNSKKCLRIYTDTYSGEIEPNYFRDNDNQTTVELHLRRLPVKTAKEMLRALAVHEWKKTL